MIDSLAAAAGGVAVGLALALTGGGGSIFAMPLLIYVLEVAPAAAVAVSLAAVAVMSAIGAVHAAQARLPVWPAALAFALGGVLGTPLGVLGASRLEDRFVVAGFAALALLVGGMMWWRSLRRPEDAVVVRGRPEGEGGGGACRLADDGRLRFTAPCAAVLAGAGLGSGVLAGLFGVGGGFVIVPVLVAVTRMGIHRAVATSLVVLAAIGLAGTLGTLWRGSLPWGIVAPFVTGGAAGMLAGRAVAPRLAGPVLQRVFASAIIVVAAMMLSRFLVDGGP